MRREFAGVVQGVSDNRRFLVIFKDWYENNMTSNQITILIVESGPMNEEAEVTTISVIPDETIGLYK